MKKSVFSLLTFIMLLCVSISCFANQPYKHPDYNLRTVKEIHITRIDNLEGEPSRSFKSDENVETKVLAAVLQAAGKQMKRKSRCLSITMIIIPAVKPLRPEI